MAENRWIWQCDRAIPSQTGAGQQIVSELLDTLQQNDWIEHDLFGVHLAVEEALMNAIKHGNQFDAHKQVHVSCRVAHNLLRVEIADEGQGFDPARIPDPTDPDNLETPSGRGVLLMRSFMTRVQYNDVGNRVIMEKTRDTTPQPPSKSQ